MNAKGASRRAAEARSAQGHTGLPSDLETGDEASSARRGTGPRAEIVRLRGFVSSLQVSRCEEGCDALWVSSCCPQRARPYPTLTQEFHRALPVPPAARF